MIKRTIICGIEGCGKSYEEKTNEGFPGWGHVAGIMNDETGETICHVCPEHLKEIMKMIKGEIRWHGRIYRARSDMGRS